MQTKICTKCKTEKPISEYYPKIKSRAGLQSACKSCLIELNKKRYKENKYVRTMAKLTAKESRDRLLIITNSIKLKYKCCFCNETEVCCLDFHHKNEKDKDTEVAYLRLAKSKTRLITEINKCIVVCSNCHRKIHNNILDCSNKELCKEYIEDYFVKVGNKLYFK